MTDDKTLLVRAHEGLVEMGLIEDSGERRNHGTDDFSGSIGACYAAIRARVAAGGKGWKP